MKILSVDWGKRRVGLAVSDPTGTIAMALRTVAVRDERQAVAEVSRAAQETHAEKILLGLPVNMNGSNGPTACLVMDFAEKVRSLSGLPVETWDERLTSQLVERALQQGAVRHERRKQLRDQMAAQVLLQGYLDSLSPHDETAGC